MTRLSTVALAMLEPWERRRHARADAVRVSMAGWPASLRAIRQRWWSRVAELDREGQGFGLSPVQARVDAELLAYIEVTREAAEAGVAVPALAPFSPLFAAPPGKREAA